MKRILSMALVLIMALSLISAVSVFAEETEGVSGKVTVYKQDFEVEGAASKWKAQNTAQLLTSVDVEANGNHYLKAGSWKADNIARLGAKWIEYDGVWKKEIDTKTGTTKNYRIAGEGITGRISDSTQVTYKNGRSYDYTWSGIAKGNGEIKKVTFGSSGINSTQGGYLLTYKTDGSGAYKSALNQIYNTGLGWTTPNKQTMVSVASKDLGNGWWSAGYNGISYHTVKTTDITNVEFVDSIILNGFFYQCSTPVDIIKALLVSEKAYCGAGFTDCESLKFTITADDLYGDEQKVDKSGKVWTEAELCKEWTLNDDCTPLYSPQRIADFQKALDEADIQYGIDNVHITADAMLYKDVVTVDEGVTVKAVTNTYTGESQTINGNGTINNVNDYYGTTYTVTGNIGGIKATYNGESVAVSESNGEYTFTIAPEKVTKNGELKISSLDKVVLFYTSIEEGDANLRASNSGKFSFANDNGNTVAKLAGWDATSLINSYINKGSTADYYPRVEYKNGDVYLHKNVTYVVSYRFKYMDGNTALTDISNNQPFINHPAPGITKTLESWGHYNGGGQHGGGNVTGTLEADGWRYATKNFTPTEFSTDATSTQFANLQPEFKGFNVAGAIFDKAAKAAVEANKTGDTVDKDAASAALAAELAKHDYKVYVDDFKLEAIMESVDIDVDAANADVKINGVDIRNGESAKVGKGVKSTIKVSVKEGYELKSVKIDGVAQTIGEDGTVTVKNIFNADAELEVVAEASYVAPSVNVSEYKTAKNYTYKVGDVDATSPYTVIMYGKIAGSPESYGFALSNGEASVKLDAKSIGADGVFAIRVVGGAILPGSYTATPYWTDGEEKTGTATNITVE